MWSEAWAHVSSSKSFPMTWHQGCCPHLTQGPRGSGSMGPYLPHPPKAQLTLIAVTRKLNPTRALSRKFQTSPVIPQIVCYELSIQSHPAQG